MCETVIFKNNWHCRILLIVLMMGQIVKYKVGNFFDSSNCRLTELLFPINLRSPLNQLVHFPLNLFSTITKITSKTFLWNSWLLISNARKFPINWFRFHLYKSNAEFRKSIFQHEYIQLQNSHKNVCF